MSLPTIYIGADHDGWSLKEKLEEFLVSKGYNVVDMGNRDLVAHDDYPDFGYAVAKRVITDPGSHGIVLCSNAQGVCIVSNKVRGIRAATGFNEQVAKTARSDDDTNVLCLPGDFIKEKEAKKIVEAWLATPFSGADRHVRRLKKVKDIEHQEFGSSAP